VLCVRKSFVENFFFKIFCAGVVSEAHEVDEVMTGHRWLRWPVGEPGMCPRTHKPIRKRYRSEHAPGARRRHGSGHHLAARKRHRFEHGLASASGMCLGAVQSAAGGMGPGTP
jgi:hypothetical protein